MTAQDRYVVAVRRAKESGAPSLLLDAIPYARFLGLRADSASGHLVCTLPFSETLIGNPTLPALHGGVIGGLLESAALLQLIWELDTVRVPKTINASYDYLRSGQAMDTFASGRITKQGRRVANVRVEAWQADPARPIAAAHGHFLLI